MVHRILKHHVLVIARLGHQRRSLEIKIDIEPPIDYHVAPDGVTSPEAVRQSLLCSGGASQLGEVFVHGVLSEGLLDHLGGVSRSVMAAVFAFQHLQLLVV